ncbi:hypothetical protein [Maledivibacter halophilus]|uniref:Uncharacterized protein n=1 Tax=Maledivibacter halophilus TaxID=36842 RepID=A0A1T5L7I2_9FIRM|nr:hypothetical protein [Maledivibacter halophilus]SKC71941.1 hypothetical protein SAMN02194393_02538 [Maledivibacter halophilus]
MISIKRQKLIYKSQEMWFWWFTLQDNIDRCIFWECNTPIWWIPKLEIKREKTFNGFRLGWLFFSVGFGTQLKLKINCL